MGVSVIIPTHNTESTIKELLSRITNLFESKRIPFEIIVVDDHSSDATPTLVREFSQEHSVSVFFKKGSKGEESVLESIAEAREGIIATVDPDLSYPPEALLGMVEGIEKGKDVIIATDDLSGATSWKRPFEKIITKVFCTSFYNINFDIQSGLKVFRKEILQRVSFHPGQQNFNLELILKSYHAGYSIASLRVREARSFLHSKHQKVKDWLALAWSAIKLRFEDFGAIPFPQATENKKGNGFHYDGAEYVPNTDLDYKRSAFFQVNMRQKIFLLSFILLLAIGLAINWHGTLVIFVAILTFLYFSDLLFNFFLIFRSFSQSPEIKVTQEELTSGEDSEWPTYTILCPLYKEWNVIPQFISAIRNLDYPKEKLQVLLLLEEDDHDTVINMQSIDLPSYFQTVVIPYSKPKTKPKALNYGIQYATGEYIVVYDAEDIPDPQQLKKAVTAFKKVDPRIVCMQAKLNFYNPHQNILTRVFTAEYSLWFDLVLTGLQSIHAPIPLGGTSNHFRRAVLNRLKGWDSFNVTEDCDLGMRLVKNGFRTAVIDSVTQEEANSNLKNWFNQRTRWIKGYIQSYFVHMRTPKEFFRHWREPHVITFQLIVGGKVLSMLINPLMWIITISYFAFRPIIGEFIESFYPAPILYMGIFSLIVGNFLYMYYYMIGCYKRGYDEIIKYAFLVPLYWLAMSIAAVRAIYQVMVNPHYWAKTKHGFHLKNVAKERDFLIPKFDLLPGISRHSLAR